MIGYVTLGTNDLERATRFYDAIAAITGAQRMFETDRKSAGTRLCCSMNSAAHPRQIATLSAPSGIALRQAPSRTMS